MRARLLAVSLVASTIAACALGSPDPGCHVDGDCEAGFQCRAGACFRLTTPSSAPVESDAGDASVD